MRHALIQDGHDILPFLRREHSPLADFPQGAATAKAKPGLAIDGAHLFTGGNDWGRRFDVHAASVLEQQRTYVKTSRKFR